MGKIWVFLLAAIAFGVGGFAAVAYTGATGSFAGLGIACEFLQAAESSGVLTQQQRADVVDRAMRELQRGAQADAKVTGLIGQFKTGCPSMPSWRG